MRNAWMHSAHTLRGPAAVAATKWHAKVVKGNERNGERRNNKSHGQKVDDSEVDTS